MRGLPWSAMRKKLEHEYICDALKGRITYFVTRYRKSHDAEGRAAVLLDGKEILQSSWFIWARNQTEIYYSTRGSANASLTREEYWNMVETEILNQGGFDQLCFYNAFHKYDNQSVEKSLQDTDPIVRLFSVLDRRVGKRTLLKIKPTISEQPGWLQPFYILRLESENIGGTGTPWSPHIAAHLME